MSDDLKCRAVVIFATVAKTKAGKVIQRYIHENLVSGDYEFRETLKGAATFTPYDAQKFIKAANSPYKLQVMAVK